MALDTRYRPQKYADVLGQQHTVDILRQFVIEGRGFHQSYVFCGQHGSGKTTMARIFARALLCQTPVEGNPCDTCSSCLSFLEGAGHEAFEELDAATKSGKSDLTRILEDVSYATVTGKRRIYLMDEAHRLSKSALDALLKPMEDSAPGSEDKRLVCIFCTTEPEKMVGTIFSRCAPAFVIKSAPLSAIADRLEMICKEEQIPYERSALDLIAEQSGSHIRDALKMLEGVSMLGGVLLSHAKQYLHLDANTPVLDLLEALGQDLPRAVQVAETLSVKMSPSSAYERIAEAALLMYRVHLKVADPPLKWDRERILRLSERGAAWLNVAQRYAAPPHRPTANTLVLDTSTAHHLFHKVGDIVGTPIMVVQESPKPESSSKSVEAGRIGHDSTKNPQPKPTVASLTPSGIYIDPRAIGAGPQDRDRLERRTTPKDPDTISPETFRELVQHHLRGLRSGRPG